MNATHSPPSVGRSPGIRYTDQLAADFAETLGVRNGGWEFGKNGFPA